MKFLTAFLLLGAAAAPAAAQSAPEPKPKPQSAEKAEKAGEDFDMGKLIQVFDKIFPPQPAPPPERYALARTTALGVLPDGTYAALFEEVMSGMVERILSISPADFGGKKASQEGSTTTLREAIARDDPHFEERMRITRRVIGEELVRVSAVMEPRLRDGLARSMARRFDENQLREINGFLATPSGKAFGGQMMRLWVDPDVMRSMFQSFPDIMMAMPGAMQRLEKETAHLPKPKKKEKAEPEESGEDAVEEEEAVEPTA